MALQTHKPASTTTHLSGMTLSVPQPTPLGSGASPADIFTVSTSPNTYDNACICVGGAKEEGYFLSLCCTPFEKKWNHPMEITKQLFSLPCSTCTLSTEPDCGGRQIWVLETMLNSESRDRCLINICGLNEGLRYSLWWWRLYCRIKFIYLFLSFLNGFSTWII